MPITFGKRAGYDKGFAKPIYEKEFEDSEGWWGRWQDGSEEELEIVSEISKRLDEFKGAANKHVLAVVLDRSEAQSY